MLVWKTPCSGASKFQQFYCVFLVGKKTFFDWRFDFTPSLGDTPYGNTFTFSHGQRHRFPCHWKTDCFSTRKCTEIYTTSIRLTFPYKRQKSTWQTVIYNPVSKPAGFTTATSHEKVFNISGNQKIPSLRNRRGPFRSWRGSNEKIGAHMQPACCGLEDHSCWDTMNLCNTDLLTSCSAWWHPLREHVYFFTRSTSSLSVPNMDVLHSIWMK